MSDAEPKERVKVNKWNGGKVKIALDDALRDVILDRGYVEDHKSTDLKLLITTVAVAIAGYGLYYSWKRTLQESTLVLTVCVLAYFALTSGVGAYTIFVEKDLTMVATLANDKTQRVEVSTRLEKVQPEYSYTIVLIKNGVRAPAVTVAQSIGAYIDWEGGVHHEVLEQRIAALLSGQAKKE